MEQSKHLGVSSAKWSFHEIFSTFFKKKKGVYCHIMRYRFNIIGNKRFMKTLKEDRKCWLQHISSLYPQPPLHPLSLTIPTYI